MTTKLLCAILFISLVSCAQKSNIYCDEILNKTPYFIRHRATGSRDSVLKDFAILKSCGQLDSIDSELLSGPMIGSMLIPTETDDKVITYKTILNRINEFKKTPAYAKIREALIISKTLENKIVTVDEFEKDEELLVKAGIPQQELAAFKDFIAKNASQKMTYKEAVGKFYATMEKPQSPAPDKVAFNPLIDLESAIKTGKADGKRVLVYFSGYASVNSRKMEENVLTDNQIKALLTEKFSCFIAYVDDKREDKASNSTVGRKHLKLQSEHFKSYSQPYFCIIDTDGKVLSEIVGSTNKPEEFIEFLNKGLK